MTHTFSHQITKNQEELDFLAVYNAAFSAVNSIVDMPDRHAASLVRLLMQNQGRLPQDKREQFSELTEEEIAQMEAAVIALIPSRGQ